MKATKGMNKYFAIDGIDGCGKTTVVNRLHKQYNDQGIQTAKVVEPGTGPLAMQIRAILLNDTLSVEEQLLLFTTARLNTAKIVKEYLANGCMVISDRSWLSSLAYQRNSGCAYELHKLLKYDKIAPKVILLDVDHNTAISRLKPLLDVIESEFINKFDILRNSFIEMAHLINAKIIPVTDVDTTTKLVDDYIRSHF